MVAIKDIQRVLMGELVSPSSAQSVAKFFTGSLNLAGRVEQNTLGVYHMSPYGVTSSIVERTARILDKNPKDFAASFQGIVHDALYQQVKIIDLDRLSNYIIVPFSKGFCQSVQTYPHDNLNSGVDSILLVEPGDKIKASKTHILQRQMNPSTEGQDANVTYYIDGQKVDVLLENITGNGPGEIISLASAIARPSSKLMPYTGYTRVEYLGRLDFGGIVLMANSDDLFSLQAFRKLGE